MVGDKDATVSGGEVNCDRKNESTETVKDAPTNTAAIIEAVEAATGEPVPRFGRPLFKQQISEISARTKVGKAHQIMVVYAMVLDARDRGQEEALLYHLGDAVNRWMRKNSNTFAVAFEVLYGYPQPLANNRGRILKVAAMRRLDIDALKTFIERNGGLEACEKYCKSELEKAKHYTIGDRVEQQSDTFGAAKASQESADTSASTSSGVRDTEFTRETSDHGAYTTGVENTGFNVQPKSGADATLKMGPTQRQELAVLEYYAPSGRKVFRSLPPTEAIRIALDLLWSAKGLKACGHSPEVTAIIEALIRLNRTPAA